MRFSDVVNLRCGSVILCPMVRFGAVSQYRKTYGAVLFGFEEGKNPTVRFGAVHRTDRKKRTVKKPGESTYSYSPCSTICPTCFRLVRAVQFV